MPDTVESAKDQLETLTQGRPVVICGMGYVGTALSRLLRGVGWTLAECCDNKPQIPVTSPIVSPEKAWRDWGNTACYINTVINRAGHAEVDAQLRSYGCDLVIDIHELLKAVPSLLRIAGAASVAQIESHRHEIAVTRDLFSDQKSRDVYDGIVNDWADPGNAGDYEHSDPKDIYFDWSVYRPMIGENYIDCGAFVGDTARSFLGKYGKAGIVPKTVILFEPDPDNFRKMLLGGAFCDYVDGCRHAAYLHQRAVSDAREQIGWTSDGECSREGEGRITVEADKLDNLLPLDENRAPTLIKMDIEGMELRALRGAMTTIRLHEPVLAICAYHHPQHLWELPRIIYGMNPRYKIFLRKYAPLWFGTVVYAVPESRVVG